MLRFAESSAFVIGSESRKVPRSCFTTIDSAYPPLAAPRTGFSRSGRVFEALAFCVDVFLRRGVVLSPRWDGQLSTGGRDTGFRSVAPAVSASRAPR